MDKQVKGEQRAFIVASYLSGDRGWLPDDDVALMGEVLVDSTGFPEPVESNLGIGVAESENVPTELYSVSNLTRLIVINTAAIGQAK